MKTYIFTRIETFTVEIEAADELAAWDAVHELSNGDSDWLCIPDDTQISCDEKAEAADLFLMSYECPCGECWTMSHECACDDRCPNCDSANSPVSVQDKESP